jgi:hypothetical protein
MVLDPSHLTYAEMLRHVGSTFEVHVGAVEKVPIRLAAVVDLSSPTAKAQPGRCFSLRFEGPGNAPVTQGTHMVDHHAIGSLPLFLVPVGQRTPGNPPSYEAIVYRLA